MISAQCVLWMLHKNYWFQSRIVTSIFLWHCNILSNNGMDFGIITIFHCSCSFWFMGKCDIYHFVRATSHTDKQTLIHSKAKSFHLMRWSAFWFRLFFILYFNKNDDNDDKNNGINTTSQILCHCGISVNECKFFWNEIQNIFI